MADFIKSFLAWILGSVFILLMFPLTVLLWLITLPAGISSTVVHNWVTFQGIILIRAIPIWKVKLENHPKDTGRPCVIISNHQSILDIPLMYLLKGNFRWISKMEIFKVPVLGQTMKMAGYIPIERGNIESVTKMMTEAESIIRRGISIIIFPEGTRSLTGQVGKFKSGAFRLALATGAPILPVIIDGTSSVLPKKGIVFTSGHPVKMKVLPPVELSATGTSDPDKMASWFENMIKDELALLRSEKE
jgi:1-acyl-sn-glycerol-3-phosphate acyltransferase